MSRLGKQPITIPNGVEVTLDGAVLKVKGPKGELSRHVTNDVTVEIKDGTVIVSPARDTIKSKALWGTYASHVHNMIAGVTEGFEKKLEIEGVGYRAAVEGTTVVLNVGFSHQVKLAIPAGITTAVEKNLITVTGADKEAVGQFAADIRKVKEPEPYKGKGIHYVGEYIIRKQGKKGTA